MALSFRAIDDALRRNPGTNAIAVSQSDYKVLLSTSDSDKTTPSHGRHLEYIAKTPARPLVRIFIDPNVAANTYYLHS